MDVEIDEVQARIEAPEASASQQPSRADGDGPRIGLTEKVQMARLEERRGQRIRARLGAD